MADIKTPYTGTLIFIGTWAVPNEYIRPESYDARDEKRILADYHDMTGARHVIYSNVSIQEVSFETPDNFKLHEEDVEKFRTALKNAKMDDGSYQIEYYSPSAGSYRVMYATLEPVKFSVWGVNNEDIYYSPITFSFKRTGGL